MKKLLAITTILLFSLSMASAQTLPETAITPDHPLYSAKIAAESGVENLAPNASAKARAKVKQAETRLAETRTLVNQNKTELANQTAKNYSKEMKELQDFGSSISDLAQQRKINELVAKATSFHTQVLSKVYEKVPPQAQAGIAKAMNTSVTGRRMAVQSLKQTGGVPTGVGAQNMTSMIPQNLQSKMGTAGKPEGVTGGQTGSTPGGTSQQGTTGGTTGGLSGGTGTNYP